MLEHVRDYLKTVQAELALGNATEHTHRPALKALVENLGERVTPTNEPKRVEGGAPDSFVSRHRGPPTVTSPKGRANSPTCTRRPSPTGSSPPAATITGRSPFSASAQRQRY